MSDDRFGSKAAVERPAGTFLLRANNGHVHRSKKFFSITSLTRASKAAGEARLTTQSRGPMAAS